MKKRKRFYDEGIRFECQGEGKCCITRGRYSYVYLSFGDRKRLAAHFSMSVEEFTRAYARRTEGLVHLDYPEKDCPFFKENRCEVYEARPWQCRTWPFWPENMRRDIWEREVAAYCPGIGKGKLYTAEEIEEILAKRKDVGGNRTTGSPDAARWDRKIEKDVQSGKLDRVAKKALEEYRKGKAKPL